MKIIKILPILLSSALFASTHYVTPNMVVKNSPMYCSDYYGLKMYKREIGDIVGGDYAKVNCSYNKKTVYEKMAYRKSTRNIEKDKWKNGIVISIVAIALIAVAVIFIGAFSAL